MMYLDNVTNTVLQQPKSLQKATHTQGGILIYFGINSPLTDQCHNVPITVEEGTMLQLTLPSSTELYTIIVAILLLMARHKMKGTIRTDIVEAVNVSKSSLIN